MSLNLNAKAITLIYLENKVKDNNCRKSSIKEKFDYIINYFN